MESAMESNIVDEMKCQENLKRCRSPTPEPSCSHKKTKSNNDFYFPDVDSMDQLVSIQSELELEHFTTLWDKMKNCQAGKKFLSGRKFYSVVISLPAPLYEPDSMIPYKGQIIKPCEIGSYQKKEQLRTFPFEHEWISENILNRDVAGFRVPKEMATDLNDFGNSFGTKPGDVLMQFVSKSNILQRNSNDGDVFFTVMFHDMDATSAKNPYCEHGYAHWHFLISYDSAKDYAQQQFYKGLKVKNMHPFIVKRHQVTNPLKVLTYFGLQNDNRYYLGSTSSEVQKLMRYVKLMIPKMTAAGKDMNLQLERQIDAIEERRKNFICRQIEEAGQHSSEAKNLEVVLNKVRRRELNIGMNTDDLNCALTKYLKVHSLYGSTLEEMVDYAKKKFRDSPSLYKGFFKKLLSTKSNEIEDLIEVLGNIIEERPLETYLTEYHKFDYNHILAREEVHSLSKTLMLTYRSIKADIELWSENPAEYLGCPRLYAKYTYRTCKKENILQNNSEIRSSKAYIMANISQLVSSLRETFQTGRTIDLQWRIGQLNMLLKLLDENRDQLCNALKRDLNKHKFEAAVLEVDYCRNDLVHCLNNLSEWAAPEKVAKGLLNVMDRCYIRKEPFGVVLIIGAWNYPVQLNILPLIGAIAAGNCVVVKPSELSVYTAKILEELLSRYLDQDCIKCISGGVPESTALLAEKWDYIFYTGNTAVGKIVMQAAAEYLTPVTLELGGKSPVFVDKDCDLGIVANRILWGKCTNAGQTCVSPDYIMCTKETQDVLVGKLKNSLKTFYGDNVKTSNDYARIVNDRHFQRIKKLLSTCKEIAFGGDFDESQRYIAPTVVINVKFTDQVMQEEIFGPILPIIPVKDEDEAIKQIVKGDKPLALYIFSNNKSLVQKFITSTSSGGVCVNDTLMQGSIPSLPFGGVGNSGMGGYHGKFTFDTFSHKRAMMERDLALESINGVRYPPFTDVKTNFAKWIMKKKLKRTGILALLPHLFLGILIAALLQVMYSGGYLS
ncbi:hypothetical protein CHS0354_000886 [Potamilus streckersoni]|uniref:Aldehyde dehydrogenase domain-containing protein n=1 Tax=Potamilus streckersoni TaxID=2493646 RepID=A0AAE0VWI1_9BIVA|nr:hypothetical protein CHS0354_000886 [Potamilus streckersoni]